MNHVIDVVGETRRACRAVGVAVVVLATAAATAACAVDGDPSDSLVHRSVPAAAFDVDPGTEVIRVPPAQLSAIVGDVSGLPVGAQIEPSDCAPQAISAQAADTVVQTGYGQSTSPGDPPPAYTSVITRTGKRLADVTATVARCPEYHRSSALPVTIVQRTVSPPQVRGADTAGYVRTETAAGAPPVTTTLLLAQRGNVRVYATRRAVGAPEPGQEADPALVRLLQAAAEAGLR